MAKLLELLQTFWDKDSTGRAIFLGVVSFGLLLFIAWFLLFSGLNTPAQFIYDQF
jgi:hypothetical protein